jgi:uncharacterized membrane protein YoaT (DUF817 family)
MIFLRELWLFGCKQAWASLFGGALLFFMVGSHYWYPLTTLARYDFLFLAALGIQVLMLLFKLEEPREVLVIFLFHIVATVMELFKTSETIGAWHYPEDAYFKILGVPLFAGFLYSAVGSYIARAWRVFDLRFSFYPALWTTWVLALAIYLNFFLHHYIWDMRYLLFLIMIFLFWKVDVYFKIDLKYRKMPLLLGFFLISFFIWIAENIGTFTQIWLYPSQKTGWTLVSLHKLGAWNLLMLISFVLVSLVRKPELYQAQHSFKVKAGSKPYPR